MYNTRVRGNYNEFIYILYREHFALRRDSQPHVCEIRMSRTSSRPRRSKQRLFGAAADTYDLISCIFEISEFGFSTVFAKRRKKRVLKHDRQRLG